MAEVINLAGQRETAKESASNGAADHRDTGNVRSIVQARLADCIADESNSVAIFLNNLVKAANKAVSKHEVIENVAKLAAFIKVVEEQNPHLRLLLANDEENGGIDVEGSSFNLNDFEDLEELQNLKNQSWTRWGMIAVGFNGLNEGLICNPELIRIEVVKPLNDHAYSMHFSYLELRNGALLMGKQQRHNIYRDKKNVSMGEGHQLPERIFIFVPRAFDPPKNKKPLPKAA